MYHTHVIIIWVHIFHSYQFLPCNYLNAIESAGKSTNEVANKRTLLEAMLIKQLKAVLTEMPGT